MTINEWWQKYNSGSIPQDIDGAYGIQCMDCANSYGTYVCGISNPFRGQGINYAKQVYSAVSSDIWKKTPYSSGAYPKRGDVIVWKRGSGGGTAGHIAIVKSANANKVTVYEANYNGSGNTSGIRVGTYTLDSRCIGWLTYKNGIESDVDDGNTGEEDDGNHGGEKDIKQKLLAIKRKKDKRGSLIWL